MAKGWMFGGDPSAKKLLRPLVKPTDIAQQWPAVNPARLRNAIKIATASSTQDGFGQPVQTWTPYLSTYAEIRQLSGQELFQGGEFSSNAQFLITMRYPTGITVNVGDRVFFDAHVYVVQIINDPFMRQILLELSCLEIDGSS